MIEHIAIDDAEVQRIFGLEESHYLDVKRIEATPGKLTKLVSAFANTAGGELFLGIGERKERGKKVRFWKGYDDVEAANSFLVALESVAPLGTHYKATFLSSDGQDGRVLHLIVFKTRDITYATDGHAYVRRGAQNIRVLGDDGFHRLRLDKGIVSFEDETVAVAPEDITNSVVVNEFILNVVPSAEPEEWLEKQNLLISAKPTVAGLLLFSDEPQAALPKRSAIKVYRYKTRDVEGGRETLDIDPITIEGCSYDQIQSAVERTKDLVEGIKRLGKAGLEPIAYPDETLHEIITNAVLHRDYSIASDVHVRIFDNRIEVESPGKLPGHVTSANILHEQSARNPKVVRIINKFPNPPNKDVGEGLNTAFEAMRRLRLKNPEIVESDNSVTVYIRHESLASPHEAVMSYLERNAEITNRIGRELTGTRSENTMKEVFLQLNKRNLIERVPGKRGNKAAWQKIKIPRRGKRSTGENR